ncbi:DUF2971 domain-containing protein [Yersinia enterocolitica]|uniref:DUF2971 domain-containing protein n=1 Tax=Yersinia enterocolitica TaxID=630 RepID=UPI003CFC68E4
MKLYKYFPPSRVDVLQSNLICFSNPLNFNDPFEFHSLFNVSSITDLVKSQLDASDIVSHMTEQQRCFFNMQPEGKENLMIEYLRPIVNHLYEQNKHSILDLASKKMNTLNEKFRDVVRVLCLSEKNDNLLMWGHYALSHTGFVIEFDSEHSYFNQRRSQSDEFGFLRKVKYREHIEAIDPLGESEMDHFLAKSKDWEYESEWRMFQPDNAATESINNGSFTCDLYKFPCDSVKSIILGCRASPDFEMQVSDILVSKKEYSHVGLFKCFRSNEKYELLIEPVRK